MVEWKRIGLVLSFVAMFYLFMDGIHLNVSKIDLSSKKESWPGFMALVETRVNLSAINKRANETHALKDRIYTDEASDKSQTTRGTLDKLHSNTESTSTRPARCRFPKLNPFDSRISTYVNIFPALDCEKNTPRVVDFVSGENTLRINISLVKSKVASQELDYCKYRSLRMAPVPNSRRSIRVGPWSPSFNSSIHIPDSLEFLQVACYHNHTQVSRSYHSIARIKPAVENKRIAGYKNHVTLHSPNETLSLLFVGIDGMSRENVIRTMPQSRDFLLKDLKAIEFKQYNKVGANTFPNVIPLLTGLNIDELKQKGWDYPIPFDSFDHLFLWNHYQQAGYRTAIQMDAVKITAFHYLKKGWKNPTFDYYPRPLNVASEYDQFYRKLNKNCMGDIPEVTYMLNYNLQLMKLFNGSSTTSKPYFLYSFFSRLTHVHQGNASKADTSYLHFFQQLTRQNLLGNTLLIVFSDHGARFGKFRNTYHGVYENKHPMLYFIFPPWFEQKYPEVMGNFRSNIDRLVTPFDLHETLKDLLTFNGKPRQNHPKHSDRGISLFSEIPINRTCENAGIPIKYCGCMAISPVNDTLSPDIKMYLANGMLKQINNETEKFRGKCVILKLKQIMSVSRMVREMTKPHKHDSLFYVLIMTTPGDAVFEAPVVYQVTGQCSENCWGNFQKQLI